MTRGLSEFNIVEDLIVNDSVRNFDTTLRKLGMDLQWSLNNFRCSFFRFMSQTVNWRYNGKEVDLDVPRKTLISIEYPIDTFFNIGNELLMVQNINFICRGTTAYDLSNQSIATDIDVSLNVLLFHPSLFSQSNRDELTQW